MQFGYFDDRNREYVITDPQTPWPWINYLGTEDFFSLISNTGGGYAFYRDAKYRRLTRYRYNNVPMDSGGRCFYVREGDTVWSPGWKPCKTALDRYECRHGLNYTSLLGEKNGVVARVLFFVPLKTHAEVQKLSLTNVTSAVKTLKIFSFIEWCLWNASTDMENFQRNFSTGEVEIGGSVIYHKTEYRERRNHYAYYSVNAPVEGFDTDRESFLGLYNGWEEPQVVKTGVPSCSVAHGWSPVASHCLAVVLQPGETKELVFVLGYAENGEQEKWESPGIINKKKARETLDRFSTAARVDEAFAALRTHWDQLLGVFSLRSGNEKLDRMVNIWNQYQCMITFCFSRSASFFESGIGRGMGFRDSNQDLIGFVHQIPERARERIIDIASTQFADGGCYHQYQPLTRRGNNDIGGGFNDDPLWLILGTASYVRETGDFSILEETVPFDNNPDQTGSLFDHLSVSLDHVVNNLGPHGLPLIGRADWNDCLNLNCFSHDPDESFQTTENKSEGTQAESLMIAGLFVVSGREYAGLCLETGREKEAERALAGVDRMVESVKRHGWDGAWFLRAYDYSGNKIGSRENTEGRIFIESNGWCTMAGIGKEEGYCEKALDSVAEQLDSPYGIMLNQPAYTRYYPEYGEISSYPPGYKENGAVFCHNNPWIMIGETVIGRGEKAWEYYRKICPAWLEEISALHKTEPYVYAQMIAGTDAARPGEAKNSWLTGTASWNFYAVSQYILGIRPEYRGLTVDPCLPAAWEGFEVTRRFRGATYCIRVTNPNHVSKGVARVTIDEKPATSCCLPVFEPGTTHRVEVEMG